MLNALPRPLNHYQHGYCYIYAIALAIVFDKGITLVWDTEAMDEDMTLLGEDCLVHAYVTKDDVYALDAGGRHDCITSMISTYPCNKARTEIVSLTRMYRIIKHKGWDVPTDDELDRIISRINQQYPKE